MSTGQQTSNSPPPLPSIPEGSYSPLPKSVHGRPRQLTARNRQTTLEALKGVLKLALINDGLARGLREASKALDRRQAHMCVLNEACEEEAYKKLVIALCGEHKIPLIKVPDGKMLGEWAGLCEFISFFFLPFPCFRRPLRCCEKNGGGGIGSIGVGFEADEGNITGVLDREGNARKVVNCSCVVVRDWGEESQERSILLNYFNTEQ